MEGGIQFGQEELEAQAIEQIETQEQAKTEEEGSKETTEEPSQLDLLQSKFDSLMDTNQKLTNMVDGFQQKPSPITEAESAYVVPAHADNLEDMSREQLVDYQTSRMIDQINAEVVKPLMGQINSLQKGIQKESANSEIEKMTAKHPDFTHWGNEIADILQSTQGITMSQARNIARGDNPTKAAELDKKFTKPDAANPPREVDKVAQKTPDVSLRPNSGATPVARKGSTFAEASGSAWEKHGSDISAALRQANLDDQELIFNGNSNRTVRQLVHDHLAVDAGKGRRQYL